jgi:RHS repeat-associated protein
MANISYRAASTMVNRYGWNGGNEYEDEGELNYSNTFYRKYDAQIGRFTGVDMLAEKFVDLNPYNFGNGNPVMFNDPTGALNQAEFNTLINTLWNSPFGGTWSSNGGGGGGGFGGGSNIYFFGNDATASFFGGLAASGINYGFGTDGNLRVNGMFVTSVNNKTRNGNAGVSFGGYYENRGNAANGSTLAGVTMGSQFFKYQQTNISASSGENGTFSSWYSNRYGQFDSQIEAYREWQANPNYHEGESFWDRTFRSIGYATMEARRDYASGGSNMFGGYGRATVAAESVWTLGLKPRGLAIEAQLGGNLPASFPTIDRFADGVATSIKSIDLTASSYQNASSLTSLVNGYINKVAEFSGANWGGVSVQAAQIQTRVLNIAIPHGAGNVGQMGVLQSAVQNGASRGVTVLINVIR